MPFSHEGLEKKHIYSIDNLATSGDYHNMIEVSLDAGSNQGVIYAKEDTGNWTVDIQDNKTLLSQRLNE